MCIRDRLEGARADLSWTGRDGLSQHAVLTLPPELAWSAHRAETEPVLGWYSPRFGVREPSTTLRGVAPWSARPLVTQLDFDAPGRV